ncbi:MAG: hypothetical protein A4E37_01593 [Methanoregulaceae archaeon PtaB.Bin056]|nr:MAG: hypothetical protein A4E37_01593 [Methanoregulaceae archaeon PtaB.Bin056]
MAPMTRSCLAFAVLAVLLVVQGVSTASVSISPDHVMPGDQVTISIGNLSDASTFCISIDGTFAAIPESPFSFGVREFFLPFTLHDGSISATLWNTGTNVMTIRKGDTEVRRVGLSQDGVFSTSTTGTIPAGTYDLISLGGEAASGAPNIVASLSLAGSKSGPDDSAITFFIEGVTDGNVTITVLVDGETALSRTLPVGNQVTITPTPTTPAPTTPTPIPTNPTPTPTTPDPTSTTPTPTPTPAGGTILLRSGWNFVSVPRILAEGHDMVDAVFAGVDTGGRSIFTYDGQNQSWRQLRYGDTLRLLDGIWIYSSDAREVPLVYASGGMPETTTKQLYSGWNTIGFSSTEPMQARYALVSVNDTWFQIFGYDSTLQKYETSIVKDGSGTHSDTRHLHPFQGYWVKMNGNGTLVAIEY